MALQIEDEDTPEGYYWTNKLVTTVRDDPNPRQSSRIAHLFVGEWVKKLDEDNGITHIKFRGGEGYISSQDLGSEKLLEIYFLDVGQGDAILVQTADNKRVLIDGGPDKSAHSFLQWKYNLAEHSKVFDAIIMSHGDSDHSKGLIRVLKDRLPDLYAGVNLFPDPGEGVLRSHFRPE